MEQVKLKDAVGKVFDGYVKNGNAQFVMKFKDKTYAVTSFYSGEEDPALEVSGDDDLVALGLLTTQERDERKAKREKELAANVETHERQLLAKLKAKYEGGGPPSPGGGPAKVK